MRISRSMSNLKLTRQIFVKCVTVSRWCNLYCPALEQYQTSDNRVDYRCRTPKIFYGKEPFVIGDREILTADEHGNLCYRDGIERKEECSGVESFPGGLPPAALSAEPRRRGGNV